MSWNHLGIIAEDVCSIKNVELAEKLHGDFDAVLNLAKEEIVIKHGCGVRTGDN